ncbi:hypothetical protein [Terribacillus sp. AE2B 122]|uniref:hypothetical protein n=1 Tax=Terribacillus sp. AE2B 122 TaxID=1331902 RepID=UPI001440B9EB|nr:hypothetical protein [Terribacillus sp. AE2B 122]VVM35137.1 true [Terribacillus sp. AE2B 122]
MKQLVFGLILLLCLVGCSSAQGEGGARGTAEDYMDAVKSGSDEASDYIDWEAEGFIDVFDYEYLETIDETEIQDTQVYSYDLWHDVYAEDYATFDDFKEFEKELFHNVKGDYEIIQDNQETLELWDGKSYKTKYTLLYNVEIANEFGEKIYKKAEITLSPDLVMRDGDDEFVEGFVVSDIYLR